MEDERVSRRPRNKDEGRDRHQDGRRTQASLAVSSKYEPERHEDRKHREIRSNKHHQSQAKPKAYGAFDGERGRRKSGSQALGEQPAGIRNGEGTECGGRRGKQRRAFIEKASCGKEDEPNERGSQHRLSREGRGARLGEQSVEWGKKQWIARHLGSVRGERRRPRSRVRAVQRQTASERFVLRGISVERQGMKMNECEAD